MVLRWLRLALRRLLDRRLALTCFLRRLVALLAYRLR